MIRTAMRGRLGALALIAIGALGYEGSAFGGAACTDAAFGVPPFSPSGYYLTSVNATGPTTNSGCQLGSTAKDGPPFGAKPTEVNNDSMFGITTWQVLATFSSVGTTSGTYDLSAFPFSTFLLAFSDGQGEGIFPTTYVGYLILAGTNGLTGTWTSPYNNGTNLTNVSEFTIYGSGPPRETSPVPIPGALGLLLAALSSLGVFGWMRRRAAV